MRVFLDLFQTQKNYNMAIYTSDHIGKWYWLRYGNNIVLAEELYEEKAYGDEPEPLEIVAHKLSDLEKLTYNEDLTEARSILALYMVRDIIRSR